MANTAFKVENGLTVSGANSVFDRPVRMNANTTIDADLLLVTGNFTVQGNYIITGSTYYDTDLIPIATGRLIGNNTNRFDGFFRDINVSGQLHPNTSGLAFGNTSRRWDVYATNIDVSGSITLANTASLGNTSINGFATISTTLAAGNTTITGFVNATSSGQFGGNLSTGGTLQVSGTSTLTGNVSSSGNVTCKGVILDHVAFFANSATVTGTSATVVDRYPVADSNFAKLIITAKSGSLVHATEVLLVHEGTNIFVTKYADLYNTDLGTVDAVINGANVDVTFQATSAGTYTVKTLRQMIRA